MGSSDAMSETDALGFLRDIGAAVQQDFLANRRLLSFAEYLGLVKESPATHLRGAAQYLVDMFDHYGCEEVRHPAGKIRRFRLFDVPWDGGRSRLVGQEQVQNRIYELLTSFVRQGRIDRCILMHGPNGSSKSTISDIIARAMEHYSTLDEGATYRFNWVFPTHSVERSGIGFGGSGERRLDAAASFAHLEEGAVDARVPCEIRDHPILLIPRHLRQRMIAEWTSTQRVSGTQGPAEYILRGGLCHKCHQIYEALLLAYEGDYTRVLRHVQVERFYVSRRYRVGTARVEPQMSVDARTRQVTADRSLAALPAMLQSIALHEIDGELAHANRGLIDFADIFKRPLEAYKYLLTAVESGQVALDQATLFLDLVFIASANETHLNALMQSPEWMSFKGRIELVRVPYLLDFRLEQQIYDQQLEEGHVGKPVAPHTTEAVALWTVLTRMLKPERGAYEAPLRDLALQLGPLEKARLYAEGQVPDALDEEAAKTLRSGTPVIYRETEASMAYEGRFGASAREAKGLLMNAAQRPRHACLTPETVLAEISELVRQTSIYDFLRQEAQPPGYHDQVKFIEIVRRWCLDLADDDVRGAMGLVDESSYADLFQRYITHVTHFVRKEKLRNEVTGEFEEPDARFMTEVEKSLEISGEAKEFRQRLMTRIGAWSVDNPDQRPDYAHIFRGYFDKLRDRYYAQQRGRVKKLIQQALSVLSDEASGLSQEEISKVRQMLTRLEKDYGYCDVCARETLVTLARARYA